MAATRDDVDACARQYDETVHRVYGVVLSVVRDPARAEQITEEVYLEIWSHAEEVNTPQPAITARLIALAHRKAVERVRSMDRHRLHDIASCQRDRCAEAWDDTPGAAERSATAHSLRDMLASWPVKERRVIELAYYGGHSCLEVAQLLGIPLDSVRGWMKQGLIRLRPTTVSGTQDLVAPWPHDRDRHLHERQHRPAHRDH